jgi:hypothetical protein
MSKERELLETLERAADEAREAMAEAVMAADELGFTRSRVVDEIVFEALEAADDDEE